MLMQQVNLGTPSGAVDGDSVRTKDIALRRAQAREQMEALA
ncbi:hypothetical protein ACVWY1_001454 [Pseudomonas sp. TE6288]|nr:hypothetical protein [Pseudomonas hunanensis]MDF9755472.1 hypothetical protein [Pseudomonas hunanensis]